MQMLKNECSRSRGRQSETERDKARATATGHQLGHLDLAEQVCQLVLSAHKNYAKTSALSTPPPPLLPALCPTHCAHICDHVCECVCVRGVFVGGIKT